MPTIGRRWNRNKIKRRKWSALEDDFRTFLFCPEAFLPNTPLGPDLVVR
jgi:hypothetical protein